MAIIAETLDNTRVYAPTISRIAALVIVDILSTAVAMRRGEAHIARLNRMKQRLNACRSGQPTPPDRHDEQGR